MGLLDLFGGDKRSKEELLRQMRAAEARHSAAIALFNETTAKLEASELAVRRAGEQLDTERSAHKAELGRAVERERARLQAAKAELQTARGNHDAAEQELTARVEKFAEDRSRHRKGLKALSELKAELKQRDDELQHQQAALQQWHGTLEAQKAALDKQKRRLETRAGDQAERDEQLIQRLAANAAKEAELLEREARVASAEQAALASAEKSAKAERALQARFVQLRQGEDRIDEKVEVIKRAGKLEEREFAVGRREDAVQRREEVRKVFEDELQGARDKLASFEQIMRERDQRVVDLQRDLDSREFDIEFIRKARDEAQALAAESAVLSVRSEASNRVSSRLLEQLRDQIDQPFLLRVSDERLLTHLAGLHAEAVIESCGHEPVTLGSGPWPEETFDGILEQAGFVPQLLDDYASEFEVFVVGRADVEHEDLANAIQARLDQGLPVRLYSQELWLLHLMTGRDPFSLDFGLLRRSFAIGHPVLSWFIDKDWDWPELAVATDGGRGVAEPLERGASPLRLFGYQAGVRTHEADRRKALEEFLACKDLSSIFEVEHHDTNYRNSWGRPSSGARLRRMVSHLRWLYRFQGADPMKIQARNDWKDDLDWMRKTLGPQYGIRKSG